MCLCRCEDGGRRSGLRCSMNDKPSTLTVRRQRVLSTRAVHRVREVRVFRQLCWGIVRRGGV